MLERMIPELEDLKTHGIFSEARVAVPVLPCASVRGLLNCGFVRWASSVWCAITLQAELKEIVAKRRDFEYLLKRRSPRKVDFLRYIKYELQLDAQRRKRKKALGASAHWHGLMLSVMHGAVAATLGWPCSSARLCVMRVSGCVLLSTALCRHREGVDERLRLLPPCALHI